MTIILLRIFTLLLHIYYIIITSLLQNGNHAIIIALLHVMQMGCLHYYVIIIHCYVIVIQTSVITHYFPFQSPELADDDFPSQALIFSQSVPKAQLECSSELSYILLCATILDILWTSCAHVHALY